MKFSALNLAAGVLRGWWSIRDATWGVISRCAADQRAAIDRALELQRRLTLTPIERHDLELDEDVYDDEHPAPVFMPLAEIPWLPASLRGCASASDREGSAS